MQALSNEQQMERLEKKVDNGFAEIKNEFRDVRAEFRSVRGELGGLHRGIQAMWLTMILGFAAILLQHGL